MNIRLGINIFFMYVCDAMLSMQLQMTYMPSRNLSEEKLNQKTYYDIEKRSSSSFASFPVSCACVC